MSRPDLRLLDAQGRPRRLSGAEIQALTKDRVARHQARRGSRRPGSRWGGASGVGETPCLSPARAISPVAVSERRSPIRSLVSEARRQPVTTLACTGLALVAWAPVALSLGLDRTCVAILATNAGLLAAAVFLALGRRR